MRGRRSKYPSLGIIDFLERWSFGGYPTRDQLFKKVSSEWRINRQLFSQRMYALERGGFIEYTGRGHIILTKTGLERVNFSHLEKLSLNKKLDGSWRLVIFDIPEKQKHARKVLRDKLVEFNFYQLQKSVYVTPYVCEDEISQLVSILGVSSHVNIIKTKSLGDIELRVRKFYKFHKQVDF